MLLRCITQETLSRDRGPNTKTSKHTYAHTHTISCWNARTSFGCPQHAACGEAACLSVRHRCWDRDLCSGWQHRQGQTRLCASTPSILISKQHLSNEGRGGVKRGLWLEAVSGLLMAPSGCAQRRVRGLKPRGSRLVVNYVFVPPARHGRSSSVAVRAAKRSAPQLNFVADSLIVRPKSLDPEPLPST